MADNRDTFTTEIYVNNEQANDAIAEMTKQLTKLTDKYDDLAAKNEKLVEKTAKAKSAMEETAKALEGMTKGTDEYAKTEKKLDQQTKAYNELARQVEVGKHKMEDAAKEVKSMQSSIESARKGTEQFRKAMETLTDKSMQNLVRMQRQLKSELDKTKPGTKEWDELAKKYQDVTERMKALSRAQEGVIADTGKMSNGIGGLQGKLGSLLSILTAVGIGITSITEAVKQSIQASQTMADKWNNGMASMKMATQAFFAAATSGDWTAFNAGLEGALKKARELAELEDKLGSFRIAGEYVQKEDIASMTSARTRATDTEATPEERKAALEEMKKAIEDYSEFVTAKGETTYQDLIASFNQMKGITFSSEEEFKHFFDRLFRYSTTGRDKDAENAKAYFDMLVERYTTVADENGAVMNVVQASSEALTKTIQKYGLETTQVAQAIEINDEGHTKLVKTYGEYADALREVATMQRTYQRTRDQVNKQLMTDELKQLEDSLKEEENLLKQQYVRNLIDKATYEAKMSDLEEKGLQERIIILTKYGANYQSDLGKSLDRQIKEKENQLMNQRKAEESAYDKAIKRLEKQGSSQKLIWKRQYAAGLIDKRTYEAQIAVIEEDFLKLKLETAMRYGKDTDQFMSQLLDRQIARMEKAKALLKEEMDEMARTYIEEHPDQNPTDEQTRNVNAQLRRQGYRDVLGTIPGESDEDFDKRIEAYENFQEQIMLKAADIRASITEETARKEYETELMWIEKLHEKGLLSEEEYAKAKLKLKLNYAEKEAQQVSQLTEMASNFVTALKEAETQKLEAEYQKQLTAAGDNAEQREQIEAAYEQKKLEIQKKYADTEMVINIAKTVAAGALAAIQAFAQLGPIGGAVAAALIAVTTAMEVATIVQQRNAIKNASVNNSGSSSVKTGTRTINEGYAEGGYTEDHTTLTTVGERGREWVAPHWMVQKHPVHFANLERYRKAGSHGRSGSMSTGFADGGFTAGNTSGNLASNAVNISDIELAVENAINRSLANGHIRAFLVRQDLTDMDNQTKRFKSMTNRG